jgi:sulfide:quinone oxidoreductase
MNKLLILGAGTGGSIMANKLRKKLSPARWEVTVVDKEPYHYYQPGFLFVPFGHYRREDITRHGSAFFPPGVNLLHREVERIEPSANRVILAGGESLDYDILIIATGAMINPEETPGLKGDQWHKTVFDFYTIEGAEALAGFIKTWKGGNMVVNIADNPIKCPVAPLEFAFYADDFFAREGMRDKVNITYVTPMSGAFTRPIASRMLGTLLKKRNINLVPDFFIGEVDNANRKIRDFGGMEIPFDCLVTIPLHTGDPAISRSGLGDDFGFARADMKTLQSVLHGNIFVIGDAGNFPSSKAGSVAHFQAEVLEKNILAYIHEKPMLSFFDGHSNCFIETGRKKGILIDFNYNTEPLPGVYPLPLAGPFSLLKETWINHLGKLLFKWIYWNILLKGRKLPVTSHMSMAGKKKIKTI